MWLWGGQGLSKDEKRLLELRAVLASGFEAVVAPASLTQRVCTRADLLNRLNAKGIAPLHVACGAHFTGDAQWRTADDGTDLSDFDAVAMEEAIASRSVIVAFLVRACVVCGWRGSWMGRSPWPSCTVGTGPGTCSAGGHHVASAARSQASALACEHLARVPHHGVWQRSGA